MGEYANQLAATMAFYGFTAMPLTPQEIDTLYTQGVDLDGAYSVASDVAAGFPFWEAVDQLA